jgi:3-hydroxybutyryl-CoA dehydrogenase
MEPLGSEHRQLRPASGRQRPVSPRGNRPLSAGVVGLGLMGTSIAACLLASGEEVAAVESDAGKRRTGRRRVFSLLREMRREGLLHSAPEQALERFHVSGQYVALADCEIVIESITESIAAKKRVIKNIEKVISPKAVIGTNTSGIPVTLLQGGARHPERILGIHWAEPAHITRFMEIICGKATTPSKAEAAMNLARSWGKEPSLLRRDIRGFLTNRVFYAMLREAFYLVENGFATPADVDRSVRNDLGYWITFAGPFRMMDLMGLSAFEVVMRGLFPDLTCAKRVPRLIEKLVKSGGRGIGNQNGFYRYTPAQAKRWERLFLKFSYEIRSLAQKYPEDVGDRPAKRNSHRQSKGGA